MTIIDDLTPRQKKQLRAVVIEHAFDRDRGCRAKDLVPHITCRGPHDAHEIIPRSAWRDGIYILDNVIEVCRNHHQWIDDHPSNAHTLHLHGYSWERR